MKTIYTTMLVAMAGGMFACSSTTTSDGGTTIGGNTTGGVATTGGTSATTGGTSATTGGAATTGGTSATTGGTTGFPTVPVLGTEIDRMGRPAINTALTAPLATEPTQGMMKDTYNADSNPAGWQTNWTADFAGSLAVYDALDGVCGNQAAATPAYSDGGISPQRYVALGGVLANDELYVDTTKGTCTQYLGVELNVLGITNLDCGGRTPLENTIDLTYSLLAAGAPAGVTNGITVKAGTQASLTVFPFLATPN